MDLRDYQTHAVDCIFSEWEKVRSTLVVAGTGTGKTTVFCEVIRRLLPKRTLVIAHREELIFQAKHRLEKAFGIPCEIEMADRTAQTSLFNATSVVIASVQTLVSGPKDRKRMTRFKPTDFSCLIIDECFPAGTMVDEIPIEKIEAGQLVWCVDDGRILQRRVTRTFRRKPNALLQIQFASGDAVICTPEHPFLSFGRWTKASLLIDGSLVRKFITDKPPFLEFDRVDNIEILEPTSDGTFGGLCPGGYVYNLEVESAHNYFANGYLVHNCHHMPAASYMQVLNYFKQNPDLKILGVTATPDRADEQALAKVCDSVAFKYDILCGIEDGWLVPVEQQIVHVSGLDFSHVRTTAGDLNGADLAALMEQERNVQGIAGAAIELISTRRAILFAASVKQAEMACEIFNRHRPGMAAFVSGETPKEQRRELIRDFSAGKFQVLANCMVATEGFDAPEVEVIIQGRPTKSRCLYTQICGRGLRPLPGVVDGLDAPHERRMAIALSVKPKATIIDFVGNSGKHKLITTADVLGGKMGNDAIIRAKKKAENAKNGVSMLEALKQSAEELRKEAEERKAREAARKARIIAKVRYTTQTIDPFDAMAVMPQRNVARTNGAPLSEKQQRILRQQGFDPGKLTPAQGQQIVRDLFRSWASGACTPRQSIWLKKHGYPTDLSKAEASKILQAWSDNGWKKPMEAIA
jgi:superfamily II DNA or RNA helicase